MMTVCSPSLTTMSALNGPTPCSIGRALSAARKASSPMDELQVANASALQHLLCPETASAGRRRECPRPWSSQLELPVALVTQLQHFAGLDQPVELAAPEPEDARALGRVLGPRVPSRAHHLPTDRDVAALGGQQSLRGPRQSDLAHLDVVRGHGLGCLDADAARADERSSAARLRSRRSRVSVRDGARGLSGVWLDELGGRERGICARRRS